jgi:hypothetical protein
MKYFKAIAAMSLNRVVGAAGPNSICLRGFWDA